MPFLFIFETHTWRLFECFLSASGTFKILSMSTVHYQYIRVRREWNSFHHLAALVDLL